MRLICLLTSVPIRKEAVSSSEKVSSLLFGETCTVLEEHGEWVKIKASIDNYEGFVSRERLDLYEEGKHLYEDRVYAPFLIASCDTKNITIPCGAYVPKTGSFQFKEDTYFFDNPKMDETSPLDLCKFFLNAPYNWGGRSIFGIDCSGLMQIIFSLNKIELPRDAYQQAELGETILFEDRTAGDIAYFPNSKGKITHVGILSSKDTIIHAAGFVREDQFDVKGIFREEENKLTHPLAFIKRVS